MKTIILHGEDSIKSYQRLKKFTDEAKKRGWEILTDDVSITPSLFGKERLTIVRDLKLLNKKTIEALSVAPGTLVVYSENQLSQTFLKNFPKDTKVEDFKLPVLIWNFLDNLYPGNADKSVQTFHKIIEREPPEFIFTLIARQFKNIFWYKKDPKTMTLKDWQVGRLKKQSDMFTSDQVTEIINKLAEIDVLVKTSKADLISELDLVLIKQLE